MERYKKTLYIVALVGVSVLIIFLAFRYLLPVLFPFLVSFFVVSMVRPLIIKLCKKTRASRFFVTVFVIFISMVLLIAGIVFLTWEIASQITDIFDSLIENLSGENNFISYIFEFFVSVEEKLPFVKSITNESAYSIVTEMITEGIKSLSIRLTSHIGKIISAIPQIAISVIVVFLSLFYFAKDYEKIGKKIISLMPQKIGKQMPKIKNDIVLVISKYIKSYALLMLLTFTELFSGFLILGIKNSFVLALIISIVDILPVLGVGTVLIPWSIVMFIVGDTRLGIGLLVMFTIIYVVRQYAEPKIVSSQMEVHPLITLFAMYAGLKLVGIAGLVFAPLLAFIIKTVYNSLKKEKAVDNSK